jgi:hypothetical protein
MIVLDCFKIQATTIISPSAPAALKVATNNGYGTMAGGTNEASPTHIREMTIRGDKPTMIYWNFGRYQLGAAAKAYPERRANFGLSRVNNQKNYP